MTISINPQALADFHVHTPRSDGKMPARAILGAVRKGSNKLKYLAFTDHDSTKAVDDIEAIKEFYDITVLPGIEISTSDYKGLHLLGLGMSERAKIESILPEISQRNVKQLLQIFFNLRDKGIDLGDKFFYNMIETSSVGRKNYAIELVRQNYARSIDEAIEKFVSPLSETGTETEKLSCKQGIQLINESGGVPCIAHPYTVRHRSNGKLLTISEWELLFEELIGYGLQGAETIAPNSGKKKLLDPFDAMARNNKLLRIGGTDFHGIRPDESIGNPNVTQKDIDLLLSEIEKSNKAIIDSRIRS